MSKNKPLGAVIGLDLLERLQLELLVKKALEESRSGRTKIITTIKDLEEDLKELEKHAATQG